MQAPYVVAESKDKGRTCEWLRNGEDVMGSEAMKRVNEMIGKQI